MKESDKTKSEMVLHSFSPIQQIRSHACKGAMLLLLIFLFWEYAANIVLYKQQINKIISPTIAWVSNIQKFEEKAPSNSSHPLSVNNQTAVINLIYVNDTKENVTLNVKNDTSHQKKKECPLLPPNLVGPLKVLTESPSFEELENMFPNLLPGGRYKPPDCIAKYKVALIIPFRDREYHLRIFLHNMHPILQRQQLDYGIYIVEEAADTKFNRAMLMNIGFVEALKQYDYDCFVFHDVDLVPEDDRNLYSCPQQPRHMSVAINTMNYRLPYKDIFGGVSALTKKHMQLVNGFSNQFWGWGGEDDDMSNRLKYQGLKITRYSPKIARYTMLSHKKDNPNPDRYRKLYQGKYRFKKDGLNSLKYSRIDLVFKKLYTWILVNIEQTK